VKRIIWSSVFLVFGLMAIAGGILKLDRGEVDCGGQTMSAGQTCVSTSVSGEETGSSSLAEQQKSSDFGNYAVIAVGALIVLIAAQNLKMGIQGRRKKEPEPLPGSLNQQWDQPQPNWQQQAPQQQYPPQQAPQRPQPPQHPQPPQRPQHPQQPGQPGPQ
jgi:hypothetical protein